MPLRAFVAFEAPADVRGAMEQLRDRLKESGADVRWEPKEKFHATIKFLGNVDEKLLPSVMSEIERVTNDFSSFDVTYGDLGCFPSVKRPRVIWIGCMNTDGQLSSLKNSLDDRLRKLGFEKEERDFHPHITLGRVKSNRGLDHLTPVLQSATFHPHPSLCNTILLMKSTLKPQGSEYSVVRAYALKGR
jgi:2'-5' RNA ligase